MQARPMPALALAAVMLLVFSSAPAAAPKPKEAKPEVKKYSGDDISRRITAALEWLVDHQGPDGQWSLKDFSDHSTRVRASRTHNLKWVHPGKGEGDAASTENQDVAGTSLGLLCFLGAGYDHKEGEYKQFCRSALTYLVKQQDADGCFGERESASMAHDSALATMAIAEAYGLSGDETLKGVAEKAVQYLLEAQNPGSGWRYGVQPGDSDTQMTGWCLLALKTARMAGVEFDGTAAWEGAGKWFDSVTTPVEGVLRTGYNSPGVGSPRNRLTAEWAQTPDMDAVHVVCRLFSGDKKWDIKNKDLRKQAGLFAANLPKWEEKKVDLAYWYYATLASYQFGGTEWQKWNEALLPALMDNQRGWCPEDKDTFEAVLDEHGSWDAIDAWYPAGGRVWSTAINVLMLQVTARYMRLEERDK